MSEKSLADLVAGKLLGPTDLTFVGGTATTQELTPLLGWLAGIGAAARPGPDAQRRAPEGGDGWWRCLEWTDEMAMEPGAPGLPDRVEMLVWGRWFGAAGDLEVWRTGSGFGWRFVGDRWQPGKAGVWPGMVTDFFAADANGAHRELRAGPEQRFLLWNGDDARVAGASEKIRTFLGKRRWAAHCTTYYAHGVIAAVRYRGLGNPWPAHHAPHGGVNAAGGA